MLPYKHTEERKLRDIKQYETFIKNEIIPGYQLSCDDFWNDLSVREIIEEYWDQLNTKQQIKILELDELFLSNTTKDLNQEQYIGKILKPEFYSRMPKIKDELGW
jgi:hypothetical protein